MSSLTSRIPLDDPLIALSGCRSIKLWLVYASVPMFAFRYPHENGKILKPALMMMRFVLSLLLFLLTAKYGLSTSVAAERPAVAVIAAGQAQPVA